LSSVSESFLNHASKFVENALERLDWKEGDWVLEIASNDGYLLENFSRKGIKVLGVEPALNIADLARKKGLPVISEFFGQELARKILDEKGYPRLIIANNVFAHVPDIQDFTKGLSLLMDHRTIVSIENPSMLNILVDLQFDSIYHEHFSYLSTSFVSRIAHKNGIVLTRVEEIGTHGGSNRYWLRKGSLEVDESVPIKIELEERSGLFNSMKWQNYSSHVNSILNNFIDFVDSASKQGELVVGYGAAAKASTLINACKLSRDQIAFIVDESPEKIGRYLPSPCIPIVPFSILEKTLVDHVVIFPWNLVNEISARIKDCIRREVQVWCLIPELRRIT